MGSVVKKKYQLCKLILFIILNIAIIILRVKKIVVSPPHRRTDQTTQARKEGHGPARTGPKDLDLRD